MNVINTIDLAQELQDRTSLSQQDAMGIVQTIAKAVDATASNLVTRDQLDARFAEMRVEFAELRADVQSQIGKLDSRIERLDSKIERFDSKIEGLDSKIERLDSKVDMRSAELRAEFHQAIRAQTTWLTSVMIAVGGLALAIAKLV